MPFAFEAQDLLRVALQLSNQNANYDSSEDDVPRMLNRTAKVSKSSAQTHSNSENVKLLNKSEGFPRQANQPRGQSETNAKKTTQEKKSSTRNRFSQDQEPSFSFNFSEDHDSDLQWHREDDISDFSLRSSETDRGRQSGSPAAFQKHVGRAPKHRPFLRNEPDPRDITSSQSSRSTPPRRTTKVLPLPLGPAEATQAATFKPAVTRPRPHSTESSNESADSEPAKSPADRRAAAAAVTRCREGLESRSSADRPEDEETSWSGEQRQQVGREAQPLPRAGLWDTAAGSGGSEPAPAEEDRGVPIRPQPSSPPQHAGGSPGIPRPAVAGYGGAGRVPPGRTGRAVVERTLQSWMRESSSGEDTTAHGGGRKESGDESSVRRETAEKPAAAAAAGRDEARSDAGLREADYILDMVASSAGAAGPMRTTVADER